MKIFKKSFVLVVCFCLCVVGLLFAALLPPTTETAAIASEPPAQQDPEQELAEAEQALEEHREELAAMLRAYYMGHAGERETKRLIEQVEEERLYVEELKGLL